MKAFKIQVNPEQSRIVQEEMFKRGWQWAFSKQNVCHTEFPYLYFEDGHEISWGFTKSVFKRNNLPELTFNQFKQQYMETLEIKKSRVIEAAKTSVDAEKLLAKLFPEVIKKDKSVEVPSVDIKINECMAIENRTSGKYEGKAFFLDDDTYDWRMETDEENCLCLIPTKK